MIELVPDWMTQGEYAHDKHTRSAESGAKAVSRLGVDECTRNQRTRNRMMDECVARWDRFNLHPEYESVVSDILDNADPEMVKLARRLSRRMRTRNFGTKAALEVLMRVGILLASLEEKGEEI